ncbi:MAG TPA: hypothetical protein VM597_04055 [Gemmataceae bacterium]|jgi:hypothetical protein|nr:hypothetical protein [Gemmataceae bacterium]
MNAKVFNLFLLVVWLVVLVGILTREAWMSPEMLDKMNGQHTSLVVAVVAMLCLWNFARFFVAYKLSRPPDPTGRETMRADIRRKFGNDPKVTDPEFNFDDPPPEPRP